MLFEMIIYFFVFLINSLLINYILKHQFLIYYEGKNLNFIKFAFNEGKSLVKYPLILSMINTARSNVYFSSNLVTLSQNPINLFIPCVYPILLL